MHATKEILAEFKMTNLERGLAILELLGKNPEGLGTSEIGRLLDLPKNFVFRATAVLHHLGYIERDDDSKTFSLSRKLLSMGYHVLKHSSLIENAMPFMRSLRNQVKETVTICAIRGNNGVVLDHVPSPHALRLTVETGSIFNLHSSAPGKAIIAFLPKDEQAELIEQLSFDVFTDETIASPEEFFNALKEVEKNGLAKDHGEELIGIECLAAPIFDERKYPIAAIVITGPTFRINDEKLKEFAPLIRDAAVNISAKMGGQ